MHILMYMDTVRHTHRHTQLADYETHLRRVQNIHDHMGPTSNASPQQKEEQGGGGFGTYQHYTELEMIMLAKVLQHFHSLVA